MDMNLPVNPQEEAGAKVQQEQGRNEDTAINETEVQNQEGVVEPQEAETETLPEQEAEEQKPSKRWAGKFESPEDLEKDYFRTKQEYNELRRQVEQFQQLFSQFQQPQTPDPIQQFAQQVVNESYQVYKQALGDFLEDDQIEALARMHAQQILPYQQKIMELEQRLEHITTEVDPRHKMLNQLQRDIPQLGEALRRGDAKGAVLAILEASMNYSPPAQTTQKVEVKPAKPSVSKVEAGKGGGFAGGKGSGLNYYDLTKGEIEALGRFLGKPINKLTQYEIDAYYRGSREI